MEEGVIAAWLKKEGDVVKAGEILAEVETDKATMELEAYEGGTLLHIGVKEKEVAAINGIIAIIGEPGEDITALLKEEAPSQQFPPEPTVPLLAKPSPTATPMPEAISTPAQSLPQNKHTSPLARKMAKDLGYSLENMEGTGEGGRIIKRDIENFTPAAQPQSPQERIVLPIFVGGEGYEDVPISKMRTAIAKRLSESKFSAPHFYLTASINMDQVVKARPSINSYAPLKISFNDIVTKALAMAIRQHPQVNAAWLQDKIRYNQHIHIGVAMAVEEGLVVPVVRFADNKSLAHIAAEIKELGQKATSKQLGQKDLAGATFTISNLGMLGIESFTAIINPPAACILAVGEIKQVPVVNNEAIVPGYIMKVTLSCDHRVVDGAVGASFLKTLKELLEEPMRMLVH